MVATAWKPLTAWLAGLWLFFDQAFFSGLEWALSTFLLPPPVG
jgi:hypothetical protein